MYTVTDPEVFCGPNPMEPNILRERIWKTFPDKLRNGLVKVRKQDMVKNSTTLPYYGMMAASSPASYAWESLETYMY